LHELAASLAYNILLIIVAYNHIVSHLIQETLMRKLKQLAYAPPVFLWSNL